MTTPAQIDTIQQLYLAYFQRPADPPGLEFWLHWLPTIGAAGISAEFARQPEYRALFAGKSNAEAVDTLYLNLFGRHADDGGLAFYKGMLDSGKASLDFVAVDILKGAVGSDFEIIDNKMVAAELFTTALGIDPVNINYYNSTGLIKKAKDFIASIGDDASVYAALGTLPSLFEIIISVAQHKLVAHDVIAAPRLDSEDMVQELFLAYFNRPASVGELKLWCETLDKSSFAAVSQQLSQTSEYLNSVLGMSHAQVVDKLYLNLFGRHGDVAGLSFYSDALSSGKMKIDQLVQSFLLGALGDDRDVLENRTIGAEMFTTSLKIERVLSGLYLAHTEVGKVFVDSITTDATAFTAVRSLPKVLQDMAASEPPAHMAILIGQAEPDYGLFGS
ncbi:DUF4214 domain-containing protein [Pseudoduganella sp. OTU4001]|uniref:DUF4214 domain-containing protein n=1 Tax=Pseudoduganella sp. OTU4001 TaxID=3043854 RepID=UPI00313CFA9B